MVHNERFVIIFICERVIMKLHIPTTTFAFMFFVGLFRTSRSGVDGVCVWLCMAYGRKYPSICYICYF